MSLGADDYLRKPFNVDELLLRVNAILRRTKNDANPLESLQTGIPADRDPKTRPLPSPDQSHIVRVGKYSLNTKTFVFSDPAKGNIRVTPMQYALPYHLMSYPNKIFSPSVLLEEVWDYRDTAGSADLIRVHNKNLLESIEANPKEPEFMKTIKGYAYAFEVKEDIEPPSQKLQKSKSR